MQSYELLYQCYTTGQMSDRQLQEHMNADHVFKAWVQRRVKENRRSS
jgi:hypothetical protein